MNKLFVKNIEDFICENCNTRNIGNGYTNHCQNCLWSKHVDNNPGDRLANCQGLMKPVNIETKINKDSIITHECIKCKHIKKNKTSILDNKDSVLELIKNKNWDY